MKQVVTLPIKGMHCASCEILISEELEALPAVQKAQVSLKTRTATLYLIQPILPQSVRRAIQSAGYDIGHDKKSMFNKNKRVYKDIFIGLTLVTILLIVFTNLGINNLTKVNVSGASIGIMALIIGLTAGFSTCMALIGGLVLGISSRHAEKHPTATPIQKFRPHLFFNIGRIVSFVVFGAIIGGIGAAFQLKSHLLGLLTLFVGVVMFLLGLQLTEIFPRLKSSLTLPSSIGRLIGIKKRGEREYSHKDSMMMGALTFFLPCGFTQAMQLYAVSTGSPVSGAIIMSMFALGTSPGLLSIGGLTSVVKGVFAQRFFRIVGVVVIMMALFNINNAVNLLGIKRLIENRTTAKPSTSQQVVGSTTPEQSSQLGPSTNTTSASAANNEPIILNTTYTTEGDIQPSNFTTKVGRKTTLIVDVKQDGSGCMSTIMIPQLDNNAQFLKGGQKLTLTFTPTQAGDYPITCAMGIARGNLTVEL